MRCRPLYKSVPSELALVTVLQMIKMISLLEWRLFKKVDPRRGRMMKKTLLLLVLCVSAGCTHPVPTRYHVLSVRKFRQVRNAPQRHTGRLYAFAGRVINTEQAQGRIVFQILVQNGIAGPGEELAGEGPLTVVYPGDKTTVAENHQVKVLGYMRDPETGKDLFGKTVTALTMDAIAVYDYFTGYEFHVESEQALFEKWKTGEPLTPAEARRTSIE